MAFVFVCVQSKFQPCALNLCGQAVLLWFESQTSPLTLWFGFELALVLLRENSDALFVQIHRLMSMSMSWKH